MTTIQDVLKWVKDARSSKGISGVATAYLVKQGMIYASDGRLSVGHPYPGKETFLVPGDEFEALIGRLPSDPTIKVMPDQIEVKAGRLRGGIRTLNVDDWGYPTPAAKSWKKLPKGMWDDLHHLRPFISDNATQPWAMCIGVRDGRLYATNNVTIASIEFPAAKGIDTLLPVWAIDFLMQRSEGLSDWILEQNYMAFRWEDGAWMRTQLVEGSMPASIKGLIDGIGKRPGFELKSDWVEAFDRVAALSPEEVLLYPDKIAGGRDALEVEEAAKTPTAKGTPYSKWSTAFLQKVVAASQYWQPDAYPKPAAFQGEAVNSPLRGLIIGRT